MAVFSALSTSLMTYADLPQSVGPAATAVNGSCNLQDISETNDQFYNVC